MAEDERDFIEHTQSKARAYMGHDLSPDEMATEFAKWGIGERVEALDRVDRELASGDDLSIDQAVKRRRFISKLRNTHETLRRVGR